MEIHLQKIKREFHLFYLIEEGGLQSYCGLMETPNYEFKNLKNIFYNDVELKFYIKSENNRDFCDISRVSYLKMTQSITLYPDKLLNINCVFLCVMKNFLNQYLLRVRFQNLKFSIFFPR